ncbi:MAG: winged helix-turn-helix domain-containing protein [Prevotella sp.]|nr:winged helix-turn-helix domain-containing protein [Prevotella sp.]
MTEKKETKAAPKAAKKTTTKKAATKKTVAVVTINAETVGFKAGDVYNALAAEAKALSVDEIAKAAKISTEEAYLGIGWLFKEGKVKDEDNKITLA